MMGGKSWLDLAVVAAAVMAFVTLLLFIQASGRGRSRAEIARTAGLLWAALALTVGLGWLLEARWGGAVFDIELRGGPRVMTRSLTWGQMVTLGVMLVGVVALYVTSLLAVRRLLAPEGRLEVRGVQDEERGAKS